MVLTECEDVAQSKVSVQYLEENPFFGRVSYYLSLEFLWEGVG